MKRILAYILVLALIGGMSFSVNAAGAEYELDENNLTASETYTFEYMGNGGVDAIVDTNPGEEYILINSENPPEQTGFKIKTGSHTDKVTYDFDYYLYPESSAGAKFYVNGKSGYSICSELVGSVSHYTGKGNVYGDGAASIQRGVWEHITYVVDITSKTFDVYVNGVTAAEDFPFRDGNALEGTAIVSVFGDKSRFVKFNIRNFKFYRSEVIPEITELMNLRIANPERELVDYTDAKQRLNSSLSGAVAMTIGNSVARVNNKYVEIYEGEPYVTPYISSDGSTLIPARFATEAIGCEVEVVSLTQFRIHKDGTTIELNTGDKNAVINGQTVTMPTAPVITKDRLFVPLRFAAETFGKNVFWDDRGLIVISDGEVVKNGQEDIIKPLISEIRNYSAIFGNKKYSDVNMTSRGYRADGFDGGQWGTLDATKRFMATVDRWVYLSNGQKLDAMLDQGVLLQGTLNANARNDDNAPEDAALMNKVTTYFLDGTPYKRNDGANGTTWGCVNNPEFRENLKARAKRSIDNGIFLWQFDDWAINTNYQLGGCFCDYCMTGFTNYLKQEVPVERVNQAGVTDLDNFNYKIWLRDVKGITNQISIDLSSEIHKLYQEFQTAMVYNYHKELLAYMEQCNGSDVFYSINTFNAIRGFNSNSLSYLADIIDGMMGETHSDGLVPGAVYAMGRLARAIDMESVLSPAPVDGYTTQLMYSAIPMAYATGQQMLVPWDDWLYGSVRYYASLEELGHTYELPREYPHLFDNYEMPEKIGYLYDSNELANYIDRGLEHLNEGIPARYILSKSGKEPYGVELEDLKGLQAVVAATDISKMPQDEMDVIINNGMPVIQNEADIKQLEEQLRISKIISDHKDVYSVLRQNQIYDDAPVVLHAVNYDLTQIREDVKIEVNNIYLPAGDTFTVNVYKPGENYKTVTVKKGEGTTVFTVDYLDRWAVMEICGANTVRRSNFAVDGYNGIGLGTRISADRATGTDSNFNIVTYSEGINSTTYGDENGCQDEAAFVYKRIGNSAVKKAIVSAGFGEHNGTHGVMIREGLYSNARFVALMYDDVNGLRFAHRDNTNKGVLYTNIQSGAHNYLKLEKEGNTYVAYVSSNGSDYTEVARYVIEFEDNIGGVFASSPDGTRSVCNVINMIINDGKFPAEDFENFKISYKNGRIGDTAIGEKIAYKLSTKSYDNITDEDVSITYKSDNENIIRIGNGGILIPVSLGKTSITAVARAGLKTISASMPIEVYDAPTDMYVENFDSGAVPSGVTHSSANGKVEVVNGAIRLSVSKDGEAVITNPIVFPQMMDKNAYFEFDFKAHFGTTQPTTGAGVIYGNNGGWAMTCDVNEFNWFFESDQRFVMPMEGDKWYHIKIYINYADQYADVYVDDKLIVEKGVLKDYAATDGTFWIRGWRLGTDTYYEWDNFRFYFEK